MSKIKMHLSEVNPDPILMRASPTTELESKHEFVIKVRDLVKSWPRSHFCHSMKIMINVISLYRSIFVVMRYLFAFLNHLSGSRLVIVMN